jgi:hypothetical protein
MSHSVGPVRRRTWPWVVAVVVVVIAIIVGVSIISSSLSGSTKSAGTASATAPASSTARATPTPTPTKHVGFTAHDLLVMEHSIESAKPTRLYGYMTDPVHITFAASDFDGDRTRDQAMTDLAYIQGATGWTWEPDPATLATFRASKYAAEFPEGALIGQSTEGYVISIEFNAKRTKITRIFVSKSAALLAVPAAPAATATSTPTP